MEEIKKTNQSTVVEDYIKHLAALGVYLDTTQYDKLKKLSEEDALQYLMDIVLSKKESKRFEYFLKLQSVDFRCSQNELTIKKDFQIAKLLTSVNVTNISDLFSLELNKILELLIENELLQKFFEIILVYDRKFTPDFNYLKNSDAINIIKDFFSLNPAVMQLFAPLSSQQDSSTVNSILQTLDSNKSGEVPAS